MSYGPGRGGRCFGIGGRDNGEAQTSIGVESGSISVTRRWGPCDPSLLGVANAGFWYGSGAGAVSCVRLTDPGDTKKWQPHGESPLSVGELEITRQKLFRAARYRNYGTNRAELLRTGHHSLSSANAAHRQTAVTSPTVPTPTVQARTKALTS